MQSQPSVLVAQRISRDPLCVLVPSIAQAGDGVIITEVTSINPLDLRIVYTNEAFSCMTGYTLKEVVGKTPCLLQGPDSDAASWRRVHDALLQHRRTTVEILNYRKDGATFWVEYTSAPVDDVYGTYKYVVFIQRDVSGRKNLEDALHESEERFRTIIENAPIGLCVTDKYGIVETVNSAYCTLCGYAVADLRGRHIARTVPAWVRGDVLAHDIANFATGTSLQEEWNVVKKGLQRVSVLATSMLIVGSDGEPNVVSFIVDMTPYKEREQHLARLANYDALTGLPNRLLLTDRLAQTLLQARRQEQKVALLFLDLDGFKRVNDVLGHQGGDLLLQNTARRLRECTRATDTVSRLAGDEFIIILPRIGSASNAEVIVRKILDGLVSEFAGVDEPVTGSIGIAIYPRDGQTVETLIESADKAMYQAKRQGKNRFAWH